MLVIPLTAYCKQCCRWTLRSNYSLHVAPLGLYVCSISEICPELCHDSVTFRVSVQLSPFVLGLPCLSPDGGQSPSLTDTPPTLDPSSNSTQSKPGRPKDKQWLTCCEVSAMLRRYNSHTLKPGSTNLFYSLPHTVFPTETLACNKGYR